MPNKGQKRSAQARLNMSMAGKKRTANNPMSEEIRKKISDTIKETLRRKRELLACP